MRTITSKPTDAPLAEALADELGPLMAAEKTAFAQRCHERQISMAHLLVMIVIEKHGALPMTRIAEVLGSGLPTATGLVSRMEDRGLVQRAHDLHDRRVVNVSLTASGADQLSGLNDERRSRITAAISHLTDGERAQLLSSIRMLRAAFERVDRQGAPR